MANKNTKKAAMKRPSGKLVVRSPFGPLTSAFSGPRKGGPEQKHYVTTNVNRQFSHNGSAGGIAGADTSVLSPFSGLSAGTAANSRIGDDILAKRLELAFFLSSKQDRPNVNYRILVVVCPDTTGPSIAQVLDNGTGNYLLNTCTDEKFTVIHDEVVPASVGAYVAGKEQSLVVKREIPLNFPVSYGRGLTTAAHADLRVFALAYDAYGTLNSDNIASMSAHTVLYFTDP